MIIGSVKNKNNNLVDIDLITQLLDRSRNMQLFQHVKHKYMKCCAKHKNIRIKHNDEKIAYNCGTHFAHLGTKYRAAIPHYL